MLDPNGFAMHTHDDGRHFPAHESLQAYAARRGIAPREAHAAWHDRAYPGMGDVHVARGPGLGLRLSDIPASGAGHVFVLPAGGAR